MKQNSGFPRVQVFKVAPTKYVLSNTSLKFVKKLPPKKFLGVLILHHEKPFAHKVSVVEFLNVENINVTLPNVQI